MNDLGIVAIGRNEGERLRRCLLSLAGRGLATVYVDSNSDDGSVDLARSMGVEVVELDMGRPFSAARARNEGFDRLKRIEPGVRYVMFVDGDCEVVEGWLERARLELEAKPRAAVVCGRRREMDPGHSIYNRLADLEWDTPVGEAIACGGDAMMRVDAFEAAGKFDPSAAAGEEPELCQRLRRLGWTVWRVDAEMTRHDMGIARFRQWWRRQFRSGYNALDIATRFPGEDKLFVKGNNRARAWGLGWPLAVVVAALAGWLAWGMAGALVGGGLVALLLPLQMLRIAAKSLKRVDGPRTALAFGVLTMVAKWGELAGQTSYLLDRRSGRSARLIEYKRLEGGRGAASTVARAEARP